MTAEYQRPMTYGSTFSGILGDIGLEQAGLAPLWYCESDPKCQSLIRKYRPYAKIYTDISTLDGSTAAPVDLICGGFPCQDVSVAGNRAGLAGKRTGLFWQWARVVAQLTPRWVLLENVPGLLSSNSGRDMAAITGALEELGYGWAYRTLDAQYFGVAQRRRRVFIVGCLGNGTGGRGWRAAAEVLFEPESLCRDTPPSREAGEAVAGTLDGGAGSRGWAPDTDRMTFLPTVVGTLAVNSGPNGHDSGNFQSNQGVDAGYIVPTRSMARNAKAGTRLDAESEPFVTYGLRSANTGSNGWGVQQDVTHTLDSATPHAVAQATTVRRLTPTECERLQGFPDGWTAGFSDSTRYKMLGNAWPVPVIAWIGRRLLTVHRSLPL